MLASWHPSRCYEATKRGRAEDSLGGGNLDFTLESAAAHGEQSYELMMATRTQAVHRTAPVWRA